MELSRVSAIRLSPPTALDAEVRPPGSKSLSNRALLLAGVASGTTRVSGVLLADDTRSMRSCLERLGVRFADDPNDPTTLSVTSTGCFETPSDPAPLFAGAAGTVARFLTAVLAAKPPTAGSDLVLDAAEQMRRRPMEQLLDALRAQGAELRCVGEEGHLPVAIAPSSALRGGEIVLDRPASSQLVSALVLAASLAHGPTRIELREGTPARPYVDMTLRVLEHFGGNARWLADAPDTLSIEPSHLTARDYAVEPDASSASYFLALAAIHGGRVRIPGLGRGSVQGDAQFFRILERMGARVSQSDSQTIAAGEGGLVGADLDLTDMPDMALTAAVVALYAQGRTTIRGVEVLRHHETDRLAAGSRELRKLGARVEERDDGFTIEPPAGGPLAGVSIETYDDHRMAMAFSLVGAVTICDPACVEKTFPSYFEVLSTLREISLDS